MENIAEILGALGIGSIGSGLVTYLGVRKKVGSSLETEYMRRFDEAIKRREERIDKLERELDKNRRETLDVVREEREQCKRELLELEQRLKSEWTRQITGVRKKITSTEREALEREG